jgi:hypothetical protein
MKSRHLGRFSNRAADGGNGMIVAQMNAELLINQFG